MGIDITPELLAYLTRKAKEATPGPWDYIECQHENDKYYEIDSIPLLKETGGDNDNYSGEVTWGVVGVSFPESSFMCPGGVKNIADAAYIASANPAVILAMIAKIKELQIDNKYLSDWAQYDIKESKKHIEFTEELASILSLVKGSYKPKDVHKVILQAVKELVDKCKD